MSLTRWKFDPRLLTIKVANTKVAEGLHTIREKFSALQEQVKTSREKLPLEAVPARALVGELITKCNECSQQCSSLLQSTPNACIALQDHLQELYTKLTQLSSLLSAIQSSNTELRPFSFDPLTALIGHIGNSLSKLEKAALAENNRWFVPAAAAWSLIGVGGLLLAWHAELASATVFGYFGIGLAFTYLLAYGITTGAFAMVVRHFYRCYRPNSKGLPAPQPLYRFWLESSLLAYAVMVGLTMLWNAEPLRLYLRWSDAVGVGFIAVGIIGAAGLYGWLRSKRTWPRQKNSYGSTRYARY
jgi:hypothetical protein